MIHSHQIRLAKVDEIATIQSIENETNPAPWTNAALSSSLNAPNQFYVLLLDNTIKAYLIGLVAGGEANLLHIVVDKSSQGKGLATKLISFWLDNLRLPQSADECWLEVRRSNVRAQKLYQKIGFKHVSVRKNYYSNLNDNVGGEASKEDALIYRLVID